MRPDYLECERRWTFWLLIFVAGWYGAYTFALRGGVFCNAQTANVVLLAMALGRQKWLSAAYLLLPISAYLFGSFLSEWMGKGVKKLHFLRWDTLLVALEMCMVVFLALMPADWPDQICQVTLNFVCAMQFNTYRQMEGLPAATTFVTNHIRQIGATLAMLTRHPESHHLRRKLKAHVSLFLCFTAGAVVSTVMCGYFSYVSLLGALIPLAAVLIRLAWADLLVEHRHFDAVPRGH
ncbi:MAG: YoaK family protein [Atopobiaceae bacterium]